MLALKQDNNPDVRRTIAVAIGNMKAEKAVPALTEACKDEAWQVRKAAIGALGNIKSQAALTPIMEALTDASDEVRMEAAKLYPRLAALLAALEKGSDATD
jgi:HEAT repeat protein